MINPKPQQMLGLPPPHPVTNTSNLSSNTMIKISLHRSPKFSEVNVADCTGPDTPSGVGLRNLSRA